MSEAQTASRRSLLKSAGVMTIMTMISRVLGLVREQVRAVYLGTGAASDAFGLATVIPNLFRRLLAEGAMTAAFLPVFVEYLKRDDVQETREFLSRFITLLTFSVGILTVLGIVVTPWLIETFFASRFGEVPGKVALTIELTQLMWPYLWLVCIAAFLQAVLNAHKIFGPSAFTPVLLNLAIIGCGVGLSTVVEDASYALVVGFLLGGVVQVVFQIPYVFRQTRVRFRLRFGLNHPGVRRVLIQMVPGVFAAGVYQINVFVSQLIAAGLEEGSIAALQYSVRLQELVLGLFVVSVAQVILPTMSEATAEGDHEAVKDTLRYAMRLMAFVTLPATAGLILVGEPIVRLLFQFGEFNAESTAITAFALYFHAAGLFAIAGTRVAQQAFYAYKDLKTPTIVAAIVTALNIALCLLLSGPLSHGGIALAGSLAAGVNGVLLAWLLRRKLGPLWQGEVLRRFIRFAIATVLMTGAVYGFILLWPPSGIERRLVLGLWVGCATVIGVVIYLGSCKAMKVDELSGLLSALKRKLKRRKTSS